MKRFSWFMGAIVMLGLAALNPAVKADQYDQKTIISISQPLEVPGTVLPPGTYVMKLLNSSSNRHIVQIMNERQNQQLALTFAISAERIQRTGKSVFTMYEGSQGEPPALHAWFYPGETVGQEFLYPHRQAVRISERANVTVPEVEAVENSLATVAPAEPATAAPVAREEARVEAPLIAQAEPAPEPVAAPEPQQQPAEPTLLAQAAPPAPAVTEPAPTAEAPAAAPETLPQTAGNGPLAALIGGLSLAAAFCVRKMRSNRAL